MSRDKGKAWAPSLSSCLSADWFVNTFWTVLPQHQSFTFPHRQRQPHEGPAVHAAMLEIMFVKYYQNRAWFDNVIAKVKWCSFFTHSVYMLFCSWCICL